MVESYEFSHEGPREDAIERLQSRRLSRAALDSAVLDSIRECDELEVWRADGCRSMAEWVQGHFGISHWLACRWIRAAHALVELPLLSQTLESGGLPLEKVVELARFATPATERKLIKWAAKVTLGTVRERGVIAETKAKEELKEEDDVRYLRYEWTADGRFLALEGMLPARQGAVVEKALDLLAQRVPVIAEDDEHPRALPTRSTSAVPTPSTWCVPTTRPKTPMRIGQRSWSTSTSMPS